jgi:tetratricopeptide (TPR) repeat protein
MKWEILPLILVLLAELPFATNHDAYKTFLQGIYSLKTNNITKATKNLENTTWLDKDATAVHGNLAYSYLQEKKQDKALQMTEKLKKLDSNNPKTTPSLAISYITANKSELAKEFWKQTLNLDPDNEVATAYIASLYQFDNSLEKSLDYWEKFSKQQPDNPLGYLQLANIQERLGLYQEVLKSYDKTIKTNPNIRNAFIGKAYIYENSGQTKLAIKEYKKCIANFPNYLTVLSYLGKCYYYALKQNYKKAEKYFLRALSTDPNNKDILYYLASLNYIDLDKYNEAIDYLDKIIKTSQNFADAYFYLWFSYDKDKNFLQAEKALLQAIKLNPKHSRAINYLGYNYAQQGIKLNESKEFITKSLNLEPKNNNFMDSLGLLYFKMYKFYLAEKTFISIMQTTLTYAHLGDTYLALKNYTKAWIYYSSSYDFKQDKSIEKKLHFTESQIPKEELYNLMLLRSKNNYDRLLSFRTGFKTKISSKILSKNFIYSQHTIRKKI